jgi:hypothetical protein
VFHPFPALLNHRLKSQEKNRTMPKLINRALIFCPRRASLSSELPSFCCSRLTLTIQIRLLTGKNSIAANKMNQKKKDALMV